MILGHQGGQGIDVTLVEALQEFGHYLSFGDMIPPQCDVYFYLLKAFRKPAPRHPHSHKSDQCFHFSSRSRETCG